MIQGRTRGLLEACYIFVAIAGVMIALLLQSWQHIAVTERRALERKLISTAQAAALMIDGADHASLHQGGQDAMRSDAYRRMQAVLRGFVSADPDVAFVYTLIQREDGAVFFVLSINDDITVGAGAAPNAQLLERYEAAESNPALMKALESLEPTVSQSAYEDEWGRFYSGYVTLRDEVGQPYGLLGVDVRAEAHEARLDEARRWLLRGITLSLALAGLASMLATGHRRQ